MSTDAALHFPILQVVNETQPGMKILANHEIDKARWDDCIAASSNGLIYARAFYLNCMCSGWSALVGENYEWVLPLTHRKKWGISYLYQPAFTQQLGIFAEPGVIVPDNEIIALLQKKYRFWEINWNYATQPGSLSEQVKITAATNFILNLQNAYSQIADGYHFDLVKNLKKSERFALTYQPVKDFTVCIDLYKEMYGLRMPGVTSDDYNNFRQLCSYAHQHSMLVCKKAINEKNEMLACALLLTDGKRLYNIMNTTTDEGRKKAANHFLIDSIIQEFSQRDLLFDFEGSDLPGVRTFYENFGVVNEGYYQLKYNRLPWPINLFKK